MSATRRVPYARLVMAALAGAILGGALGNIDWLFLARHIDFDQVRNFKATTGELVSLYLVALNVCCGIPAGLAIAMLPPGGKLGARILRGAVLGGYVGTLLGFIDVVFLAHCFQALESDLVGAWRDNRSLLVILNAAGSAVAGALASLAPGRRS